MSEQLADLAGAPTKALEISGGTYESPAMNGGLSESTRRREAYFVEFAERMREITTVPLMVTGVFARVEG
jgi:2,4-dienoyl-CoA reductase-like NADH-dependent reductase (Old Yellow Enzyme family)